MIRRARSGDRDALGQLWRSYQHLLLRYFRGKGMPWATAEDLASTVWLDVASALDSFEGSEPDFRRWLFTIAARRRIDDIRSSVRRQERQEREVAAFEVQHTPDVGDRVVEAEALERALALIRTLPPDQAEAVLLRVVGDLSVAEVAEIMQRREGAVRVLVHRGLKRLSERVPVTESTSRTMYAP